ncbi:MAG: tRNA (cytidine(56)-2'-O)-methyltransferase [Thermoplasmata archaeon]|nr:tRNA (cytidine(56)-2'-O)-methyltransferase [Thermoplasmata archaeon]
MAIGSSGSRRTRPNRTRPVVDVLRIGHRVGRDPRLTTHLALTARALGARRMYLHPPDPGLAQRVEAVRRPWGGEFEVLPATEWKKVVRTFPGSVVHLTMYGEPIDRALPRLRRMKEVLLVVGGAKVPSELYQISTFNVAVGHQPHSEVAALAVALERLLGVPGPGAWPGAKKEIIPMRRGKKVIEVGPSGS